MTGDSSQKEKHLSDHLYVLYKWKKFFIINLSIISIITVVFVLLMSNQYQATATVMIPPDNQSGLSGLTGLLKGNSSIGSLGAQFLGVSNTSEDLLLGIINSRSNLVTVIEKFNLMDYYEIDDHNMDKTLKSFHDDLSAELNEYGMLQISVVNKDSLLSAEIANYIVSLVDSTNIRINMENAKNNRSFIEKRYLQNIADLKNAEDSLYLFQKRYGIVAVPEQLEVSVKAAAEIESELIQKEMRAYFVLQQYGENSPQYQGVSAEIKLLREKVMELKNTSELTSSSNVLFSFNEMPDIVIKYLRFYREVEIQQSILEIILPMYEQAKVEEQKSIPTIVVLDKAVPPQLKHSPKRSAIVLGIFFLFLFMFIPFIFAGEKAINRIDFDNPLQIKHTNFMKRVVKIYRIKF